MDKLKLTKHYSNYLHGIKVYYLKFKGVDETFMTLQKCIYDYIVKKKCYEM